jgi:hypothetical protein
VYGSNTGSSVIEGAVAQETHRGSVDDIPRAGDSRGAGDSHEADEVLALGSFTSESVS